jgi:hypothetical protein
MAPVMRKTIGIAAGVLLLLLCSRRAGADEGSGSMPIPTTLADLAKAAGLARTDPSTLPLDIVRLAFASPDDAAGGAAGPRTAIRRALETSGDSGDRLPLPLSPATWRARVLHAEVPDARLAAAIFSQRATALLYHGLLALDPATLAWIDTHPDTLDVLLKHPGATAAFARSIHIRSGSVTTPGDAADDVWKEIVGADPRDAPAFVGKLIASRDGRVAAFYDAVTHLDTAHQRFALGTPGDPKRIPSARKLADAVLHESAPWRLEEYPFMRPDTDLSVLFRRLELDAHGTPVGPSKQIWADLFGESGDGGPAVDAAWLATAILKSGGAMARHRQEVFFFAQRALASDTSADPAVVTAALRDFSRYPVLMLTLENNGVRTAAAYAAAGRAAGALGGDEDAIMIFQGSLAIVDRIHSSGTLATADADRLIGSLVEAAAARPARAALLAWLKGDLLPSLTSAGGSRAGQAADAEALVLQALAGPPPDPPVSIEWEGQRYSLDPAQSELRRLTVIRRAQQEAAFGEAIVAATPHNLSGLSHSLTGLVYATAIGEPDSQATGGGQVWRRHRLGGLTGSPGGIAVGWRLATEVFGGDGWHLTGSLLQLHVALANLALRRLDATEMPAPSSLSTMDRRSLARTIAVMNARAITDAARDEVAGSLARGRARVAALVANPGALDAVASEAALSEWRLSAIRWLLAHDAARVPASFTTLELFRLGGGTLGPGWGAASYSLDGCFCLRMPDHAPWEEYAGRASTGQLATELADVMLRTADALSARHLPALLTREVAAFAMQDAIDIGPPAYFDDWLSLAFAARDLTDDRFDDYVAALTASGPLIPVPK